MCDVGLVYKVNVKDVCVCDVQMFFVDVLIGVYFFVLVWQGQIFELINFKFKVWCWILEEVVGILGFYQWCYEVELKFKNVELNLICVDDVIEQLVLQFVSFVRQVKQVVCYCVIGVELC